MELAKGGELFDKLLEEGCLSEKMAARVITQVALVTVTEIYDENYPSFQIYRSWRRFMTFIPGE